MAAPRIRSGESCSELQILWTSSTTSVCLYPTTSTAKRCAVKPLNESVAAAFEGMKCSAFLVANYINSSSLPSFSGNPQTFRLAAVTQLWRM